MLMKLIWGAKCLISEPFLLYYAPPQPSSLHKDEQDISVYAGYIKGHKMINIKELNQDT